MSQSVPPPVPFPAEKTGPKYQNPSMITPMPHIPPSGEMKQAKGLGAASFVTAILGVIFWAVKEMGGLPSAAQWVRGLSPLVIFCLSLVLIVAAAVVFGVQILRRMDEDRIQSRQITEFRDQRQTDIMNELARTQARQEGQIQQIATDVGVIMEAVAVLTDAATSSPPSPSPSSRTQPDARRPSAQHEQVSAEEDTPTETMTAKRRRLAPR